MSETWGQGSPSQSTAQILTVLTGVLYAVTQTWPRRAPEGVVTEHCSSFREPGDGAG